jgi:hypothetical protein
MPYNSAFICNDIMCELSKCCTVVLIVKNVSWETNVYLVKHLCKVRFLRMCNELPIRCSPLKYLVLNM